MKKTKTTINKAKRILNLLSIFIACLFPGSSIPNYIQLLILMIDARKGLFRALLKIIAWVFILVKRYYIELALVYLILVD